MAVNKKISFMDNQLMTAGLTTSSSAVSGFPLSNIFTDDRFKVTKFAGNFEITASNQNIYINDGSDKTASLTIGSYTYSTLATEIAAALNIVSSSWTCTYDFGGTNKFTVDRTSGTKTLRLSVTASSAWDSIGFTGVIDQDAGQADEQRNHTSEWIVADLATNANDVGFLGIISPVSAPFPLSEDATIRIQASNLANWAAPDLDILLTYSDFGLFKFITDDASYRYFRIEFIDRTNTLGPEGIGFSNIYIGTYTTVVQSNVSSGFSKEYIDPSVISKSENGVTYANIRQKYLSLTSISINYIDQESRLNLEQMYYDFGLTKPFWVAFDPSEDCSDIDELTRYVYFEAPPVFTQFRNNVYSMEGFSLREAL